MHWGSGLSLEHLSGQRSQVPDFHFSQLCNVIKAISLQLLMFKVEVCFPHFVLWFRFRQLVWALGLTWLNSGSCLRCLSDVNKEIPRGIWEQKRNLGDGYVQYCWKAGAVIENQPNHIYFIRPCSERALEPSVPERLGAPMVLYLQTRK